eukprot:jgi/Astpho2/3299/Aster-x0572
MQEQEVADAWLLALMIEQATADRLLKDMKAVDRNLHFWQARLKQGSHLRFMLFGQGPLSFVKDVVSGVRDKRHKRLLSATDKIERRIIVLRSLRGQLAEALAEVQGGAARLHLRTKTAARLSGEEAVLLEAAQERGNLFSSAIQAVVASAQSCAHALHLVHRAAEECADSAPLPSAASQDSMVRQAAMQHAFRSLASKRMFHVGSSAALSEAQAEPRLGILEESIRSRMRATEGSQGSRLARATNESEGTRSGNANGQDESDAEEAPAQALPTGTVYAALRDAQRELGSDFWVMEAMSANAALSVATQWAARQRPMIHLPKWIRMPSKYEQHWIRYTLIGVASSYGALFVYRHSRLSGSRDLEVWTFQAAEAVRNAYRENLVGPIATVKDELFKTFRQRRSIVSPEEFEMDKASLRRMLEEFERDNAKLKQAKGAAFE